MASLDAETKLSGHDDTPFPSQRDPEKAGISDRDLDNQAFPSDSDTEQDFASAFPAINETKLIRKLDLHIMPGVCILYLLSFLDRSNVANAKLDGLDTDLHMTGNQYDTGLTLFFVGYVICEVAWNLVLRRIGPKIWLPTVTFVWGVIATLQGVVQYNGGSTGVAGYQVIRFFLGLAEGGLFPGVVFFLSMWYLRSERQYRVSLFFSAASLAGAFGGILAYGIGFMDGVANLRGWRWIFIIEGILTCVLAAAGYWYIPDWPSKAKFVNDDERAYIHARLKVDNDAAREEAVKSRNIIAALKDIKVWLYGFTYTTLSLPLYTLSFFLPTIISELGYKAWQAQLLTVPPYVLSTITTIGVALISERVKIRAPFIIGSSLFAIIGYCILLGNTNPTARPGLSYAGVFFCTAGIYPAVALTLSWPAINVSGQTKRATATAMQITIGNLGAVIGTQLYREHDGPRYIRGHSTALAFLAANCIVVSVLWAILARTNKQRAALVEQGGPEVDDDEFRGDDDVHYRFRT